MNPDYFTPEGICSRCHGSGKARYYHGDFDTCPTCHGSGKTEGIPVFVDRQQRDGGTYPDERIEVYHDSNGWQPIETAPKDGTRILIWNGVRTFLAYWNPQFESEWSEELDRSVDVGKWTDDTVLSFSYETTHYIEHPTHWMPLPDPPKETARHFKGKAASVPCAVPERKEESR